MDGYSWRRLAEWPLLIASVAFLVAFSIEVIGNLPDSRSAVFNWVIWGTWALFIIDCAGRVRGHHEHASCTGCLTRNCHLTVQQTHIQFDVTFAHATSA